MTKFSYKIVSIIVKLQIPEKVVRSKQFEKNGKITY